MSVLDTVGAQVSPLRLNDLAAMAWRSDSAGERIEFNAAWVAFTGRQPAEEAGSGWAEGVHPEDRLGYLETVAAATAGRRPYRAQYRLRHREGHYRPMLEFGGPAADGAGYVGVCFDLSTVDDHTLSEHVRDALLLVGPQGEILEANHTAERLYGYSREELRQLDLGALRAPEVVGELDRQLAEAWDQGVLFETVHRAKDGRRIEVEVSAQAARIDGRRVVASLVRDVTERNRIRSELSATESRHQALFEHMREGVAVHRLVREESGAAVDYVVTDVNPAFAAQTGLARDAVVGKLASVAYGTEQAPYLECFARVAATGAPESFETYFEPLKSHFAVSVFALGGDRFGTVFSNITERKKVEDQLRQAQKMEAVGRLAGGVAHDFSNLLTVVLGYSDALLESIGPESPLYESVVSIREAGERASHVTAQLLAFSRRQLLRPEVLEVNAVVRETSRMLRRLIGEDIAIETVLDPALWQVRADAGQLTQVLLNLAVNSRDAMPRGGKLTIETANTQLDEIYARAHPGAAAGDYVMLAVTDTGSGMDADTQSHIFEPFFTTKPKGTGLGLPTVYGIIKQSGGEIGVYSEPGRGTTFKMYLPRERNERAKGVRREPQPPGGRETLLVVEDEAPVAGLIAAVLGKLGYRVLTAGTPEEALRVWREHAATIHLVLSDVILPGMSGPEVVRVFLAERPGLPVLYMSGYPNRAVASHGVALDGAHFLQKPFTARELAHKVRALLDREPRRAAASGSDGA